MKLGRTDPLSSMLTRGTVLWRPMIFRGPNFETHVPEIRSEASPTREGQQMLRLNLRPEHIWEPCVESCDLPGIVIFLDEELPQFWTHLVVVGISKSLRDTPRIERGGAVFAKLGENAVPFDQHIEMRRLLAMAISKQDDHAVSARAATARLHPAFTGCQRLVFRELQDGEYEYEHVNDPR